MPNADAHVQQQYSGTSILKTRISLHERFSRNKQPFYTWIIEHYPMRPNIRILEVGCGTGAMWRGVTLPEGARLTLTDMFPAMCDAARESTAHMAAQVSCQVADVQALPFADSSFDLVCANMMLHFVPDIDKALSEVRRVLAPNGTFCAVTLGQRGHNEVLMDMIGRHWGREYPFSLENGATCLQRHFAYVTRIDRDDALDITDLDALVDYIRSLPVQEQLDGLSDGDIKSKLAPYMQNGVLTLPKAYGVFIAK